MTLLTSHTPMSIRIIESIHMTKTIEDWSRVRSPSRAERRRKQGHKQNITIHVVPRTDAIIADEGRTMIMHPQTAQALRDRMALDVRAIEEATICKT